jgi:SAM-dependent methyltransferase
VNYRVESAEEPTLSDGSVDLITAAQAAHWFDLDRFYRAARSAMKPDGVIALWCYGLHRVDPDIDATVDRLYHELLGEYWPKERRYIDNHYRDLPFPFTEIETPSFAIECNWTMEDLFAYLDTWSAVRSYRLQTGDDPLLIIRNEMVRAWGTRRKRRTVAWPLFVRVGHR